jgi:hypothetical protein
MGYAAKLKMIYLKGKKCSETKSGQFENRLELSIC